MTIIWPSPRVHRWVRIAGWVFGGVGLVGLVVVLTVLGSVPSVRWLRDENPATTAFMDRNREIGVSVTHRWAPLERVSPHLLHAILVAEDIEFFQHRGFSYAEQRAAVRTAISQGSAPRGASTITQQLAKNLWLTPERSAWRKLREAALAWKLERTLGKRRILELYVNVVEFGPGLYGVGAAAERYFRSDPLWLAPHQAAQLAAGLSRPSQWNPSTSTEAYGRRIALIRGRMDRGTFLWRHLVPLFRATP